MAAQDCFMVSTHLGPDFVALKLLVTTLYPLLQGASRRTGADEAMELQI